MGKVDVIAERVRLAVAAGLAMGITGCGPSIVVDDGAASRGNEGTDAADSADDGGDGGDATDTSAGQSSVDGAGDGQQGTTAPADDGDVDDDAGDMDDAPILDVGGVMPPDPPGPSDCFGPPPPGPECIAELGVGQLLGYRCVPQTEMFTCDANTVQSAIKNAATCLECNGFVDEVACGPAASGVDTCCYWFVYSPGISCPGRPFTVDGASRLPAVERRLDWHAATPLLAAELDEQSRQILATAWAAEGCFEAASVASFSRFVLELLSVGAPSALLADAQRALGEEIGHGRAFFGLASAYGGDDVGPGALDIRDALATSTDLASIAFGVATEGCIGETISALQLNVAARRTRDPQLRAMLIAIAEEELEHAELAWRTLGWLLRQGDDVARERVANAFANATDFVPRGTSASDTLPAELLAAHGRLTGDERLELAQRALTQLVAPAAGQLLAQWTTTAHQAFVAATS